MNDPGVRDQTDPALFSFRGGTDVPGAGWDEYKALYSRADVRQDGPRFSAEIHAARLDGVLVFDRRLSGVRHERNESHTAEDGFDHFVLQLALSGEVAVDAGHGFTDLVPGEAVLLDLGAVRRMRLRFHEAHLLTASIARSLIVAVAGPEPQDARRLEPSATETLRVWLQEQAEASSFGTFAAADRPQFLTRLLTMLAPHAGPGQERSRRALVQQAMLQTYVDANLHRRDLSGPEIARACGMSRSALYRLIAPYGGAIRYVHRHRLAQLERLLAGGDGRPLRVIAKELGFADASHMVRQFSAAAGVTPGRYRRLAKADATAVQRRWATWMGELR